jgi:hypothetical protein
LFGRKTRAKKLHLLERKQVEEKKKGKNEIKLLSTLEYYPGT